LSDTLLEFHRVAATSGSLRQISYLEQNGLVERDWNQKNLSESVSFHPTFLQGSAATLDLGS
jgi:hypothetical protein